MCLRAQWQLVRTQQLQVTCCWTACPAVSSQVTFFSQFTWFANNATALAVGLVGVSEPSPLFNIVDELISVANASCVCSVYICLTHLRRTMHSHMAHM